MASNEKEEEESFEPYDHDSDEGFHNQLVNKLSRLSMCTSSVYTNEDSDDVRVEEAKYDDFEGTRMMSMSRLSIEGFEADNEEQMSDEKEGVVGTVFDMITSWDSDEEQSGCFSLPATPPRRRRRSQFECASENEAQKGVRGRRKRVGKEDSFSGGGGGVVVITRPKGGKRSLCMDLEEVKACRDLGFELEHERMLEINNNSFVSVSGSTLDTSSGGNSPIANWRISSPGDDPRDVKARLKVWAQAVALASTSRCKDVFTHF